MSWRARFRVCVSSCNGVPSLSKLTYIYLHFLPPTINPNTINLNNKQWNSLPSAVRSLSFSPLSFYSNLSSSPPPAGKASLFLPEHWVGLILARLSSFTLKTQTSSSLLKLKSMVRSLKPMYWVVGVS
ncbi:hypothetical protein L2E82_50760 [Cichorium intybus]|nr:hypothetical protein L2E82_50760 [Cichorium intybus]